LYQAYRESWQSEKGRLTETIIELHRCLTPYRQAVTDSLPSGMVELVEERFKELEGRA
jgi:hypothetical protein